MQLDINSTVYPLMAKWMLKYTHNVDRHSRNSLLKNTDTQHETHVWKGCRGQRQVWSSERIWDKSATELCVYELTVVTSPTRMFMGSSLKAKSSAVVDWERGDWENEWLLYRWRKRELCPASIARFQLSDYTNCRLEWLWKLFKNEILSANCCDHWQKNIV